MEEAHIEKIENGYTVFINYKKYFKNNKKELLEFLDKELK